MKKIIYLFITASLLFTSCSKDDEPVLSRTEMISRTWVWEEVTHTSTTNGTVTTDIQDLSNSDYEQEFKEDGTLEIRNDGTTLTGTWSFVNDYTLHTIFDFDPNTIYSSAIIKLSTEELWISLKSSSTDPMGIVTVNVSESKFQEK
jgi:hypothetical protein